MSWLFTTVCILICAYAGIARLRRFKRWERKLIRFALFAQLLGSLALIGIYRYHYDGGDLINYQKYGSIIAAHMSHDFGDMAPRVLELLFQRGSEELVPYGGGTSTGSMHALSGILAYILGDSLLASSLFVACGAFYGKLAIYYVLRSELKPEFHKSALIGSLLVPSAIFWSGSLLKESVVMSFLGAFLLGGYFFVAKRRRVSGSLLLGIGVIGCALFKAYLLVPSAVASIVWLYVRYARSSSRTIVAKPIYLVMAGAAGFGLLVLIGSLYPRYDVFRAEKQLAQANSAMSTSEGGSNYQLLDSAPTSSLDLVLTSPWALFTALLRPSIIEARNPLSLANGMETLVLTIMLISVVRKRGIKSSIEIIRGSPILAFCAIFVLLLGLGVGFATTNMGTLSRYRMPLMPFFVVLLGVLASQRRSRLSAKHVGNVIR